MSEKEFQKSVKSLAYALGWLTYHTFDSRRSDVGFPDLVLVKDDRLIFAELKSEKGKLTIKQDMWLQALDYTDVETYVWRPSDLPAIARILR